MHYRHEKGVTDQFYLVGGLATYLRAGILKLPLGEGTASDEDTSLTCTRLKQRIRCKFKALRVGVHLPVKGPCSGSIEAMETSGTVELWSSSLPKSLMFWLSADFLAAWASSLVNMSSSPSAARAKI